MPRVSLKESILWQQSLTEEAKQGYLNSGNQWSLDAQMNAWVETWNGSERWEDDVGA